MFKLFGRKASTTAGSQTNLLLQDPNASSSSKLPGRSLSIKRVSLSVKRSSKERERTPSKGFTSNELKAVLEARELASKPPDTMGAQLLIDRYWRLGDVVEDKGVVLSWRLRIMIAHDVIKELKKMHVQSVKHGKLVAEAVVMNQDCTCKLVNVHQLVQKTSDPVDLQKDILCFGVLLAQLALHQTLEFGAQQSRQSLRLPAADVTPGLDEAMYDNLRLLFTKTMANEDVDGYANSLDFADRLATEVRELSGFKPRESENVPADALQSFQELTVQCCSPLGMNRPEVDAVEDWLSAIVDMVGGSSLTAADKLEREKVLWTLQPKDSEVFDSEFADESDAMTGKIAEKSDGKNDEDEAEDEKKEGYETDDSFYPDPPPAQARRPSRLSMFIVDTKSDVKSSNDGGNREDSQGGMNDLEKIKEKKKVKATRMSIKPTATNIEKFAGIHRRASGASSSLLTPAQCREKFDKQERLNPKEVAALLDKAEQLLRAEPNLPTIQAPCTVVGDLHGQYFDLAHLVDLAGEPGKVKYLFLGDYVDRGDWSCEVLFYILAMKCAFPDCVTTIRGNHECDAVSSYFGFKEEVEAKYGRPVFFRCLQVFQSMPMGAILDTGGSGRFLCVHGGISPHVTSLEQFETTTRFNEPGMNGFMCDVLWADPVKDDFDDGQHSKSLAEFLSIDFVSNPARGCSFRYGYSAIVKFLATNRLVAIIRAHEVMQEGYRYHFQTITGGGKGQARIMPPVITVFSAPNYLGTYGNQAAFLRVTSAKDEVGKGFKPIDLLHPVQFNAVAHPVPLVLESETLIQKTSIEKACPYMPTTFDSFLHRALEFALGEDEDDLAAIEAEVSMLGDNSLSQAPEMETQRKEELEKEAKTLLKGIQGEVKMDMQGADLFKGGLLVLPNRRQSLQDLRDKKGVSGLIAQFSKAAAADGINEMHPMLVQEKMNAAKKKLETQIPANPSPAKPLLKNRGGDGDDDNGVFATGSGQRRTVVANRGSQWHAKKEKSDNVLRASIAATKKVSVPGGTISPMASPTGRKSQVARKSLGNPLVRAVNGTTAKDFEVDFSEDEIVALQMLYLMIDRDGDGKVTSKELTQWSAVDGSTISAEEATLCCEALDLDEDGFFGFMDYLAFAARLKIKSHLQTKKNSTLM